MMNTIKIRTTDCFRPEKEYVFHVLLSEILGLDYVVEYQAVESHILQIPNGAALQFLDEFPQRTQPHSYQLNLPPADPFFATFWILTRLEEAHNPDVLDAHGRFPAAESQAFKQGFLHRPVVNEWADELWDALVRLGWQGARRSRKFQLSLSCDVDHPRLWWSAADRVKTLAGALFRRGDISEATYWFKNHLFEKKDPYNVFEEWLEIFAQQNLIVQFNFMGARPRSSDCWHPLNHPFIGRLMAKIAEKGHKIGFHPSYEAYEDQSLFEQELASLRAVSPVEITAGRQHYLRFSAPKTWQMWEAAGLLEDSTVGFAEAEGFRCGICHDFPVFDTKQRKMLQLREKPLIAMDVSLAQYRSYMPEQGLNKLNQLRTTVEKHQGDFTLLWHNSSWNTPFWKEWKAVFRKFIATTCLALFYFLQTASLSAQSTGIPLHAPAYHILDRLEIQNIGQTAFHPELKFIARRDAAAYAMQLDTMTVTRISRQDQADIQYLLDDNNEYLPDSGRITPSSRGRKLLKWFYQTPAHFFEVDKPNFRLRVNPLLNLQLGHEAGDDTWLFQNQRGLEVRGEVDQKLFFYTNLIETQARYPKYVAQRVDATKAVPGAGFFKGFKSRLLDTQDAYDFNVATAYVGFQATRHFGIQLGHGRHFIGNGYRSMLLSDFGAPTFFLKFDTRVWKLHYQNLFLELSPVSQVQIPDGTLLPKKYAAIHYLSFKVTPRLAFGFFEATVFNRSRQFELQYLNPVVFYRTVEGMIGSPDNVLLGLNGRWNLLDKVQLYGQIMLDELSTTEVFSGNGWWANKWGMQLGAKYINAFGVDHLDLQLEHNWARPYTYAHADSLNSYTHYNQTLSHPLGANFRETLLLVRWQPCPKLTMQARVLRARVGEDAAGTNWGGNPLRSNASRVRDYDNFIGQGVGETIDLVGLDASWAIWHNLWLDLKFLHRKKHGLNVLSEQSNSIFSAGIRLNLWNSNLDF